MEYTFEATREPLVPSRKSSLNARPASRQEHNRRKTSSSFDGTTLGNWKFDAVTLPAAQTHRTYTFSPISTILRAHLPLSWLDNRISQSPQSGTLLKADIFGVPRWEYHILIARVTSGQTLYAFERVESDTYVCYALQSWVKSQWVEQAAIGAAPPIDLELLLRSQSENTHSRKPSTTSLVGSTSISSIPASPKIAKSKKGQLARLSILETRERTEEPPSMLDGDTEDVRTQPKIASRHVAIVPAIERAETEDLSCLSTSHLETGTPSQVTMSPFLNIDNPIHNVLSAEPTKLVDHLSSEHLRRQYLETLYCSKTSLAFFAKGPLSRARARARVPDASRTSKSLADFYLESILSSKKMDLKYKDSIQKRVTDLGSAESNALDNASQKRQKTGRTKLGKDGLWPLEGEYIEKWWNNQDFNCESARSLEHLSADTKRKIAQLRMRETEMQIVLILEILALEARDIPNQQTFGKSTTPEIKIESTERDVSGLPAKVSASKKKRNLKSELDLLVDRLCIWHSVGLEDFGAEQIELQNSGSSSDTLKNRLREFCKDVIIPFYCAKLPAEGRSICLKMGGPDVSSQRSKSGPETDPLRSAPGSAITQDRLNKKRNLHRVLSEDETARHTSPPTLLRSATLPASGIAKREPSERPASRTGLQKSVSFSNREVDLVADARATTMKRRKLDLVTAQKRELDEAIQNLKRPNRSTVAKSIMDDIERRTVDNKQDVKKVEPVQISATPRRNRTKAIEIDEYDVPVMGTTTNFQEDTFIPSSATRPKALSRVSSGTIPRSSAKRREVLSAIYDTPSKGATRQTKLAMSYDGPFVESETAADRGSNSTLVASTPATSRLRLDLHPESLGVTPMRMSKSLRPVLITPLERSQVDIEQAFRDAPEIPERAGKMMDRVMGSKIDTSEASLYDSLGWNDDYDL